MSTAQLHFDRNNPRFFLQDDMPEAEMAHRLWRDFAVEEVALSIAYNGYFSHEPLFVAKEDGRYVVVEGNRRLAAVRILTDGVLRKAVGAEDLPVASQELIRALEKLPVIKCSREGVWQYIGFKHVNGPQPWQSYAKAQYVARVHNDFNVPLDEIASRIGDKHWTVRRLYRGLMVLRQAETSGVFDLNDRYKKHFSFSHLYTALDYKNYREFLGIDNKTSFTPNPIPENRIKNLKDICLWLYGQDSTRTRPLIQSQNPHLRQLGDTLDDYDSLAALRQGLSLEIALDIRKGDRQLFRGYLLEARYGLQLALGKELTGDTGDRGTLQIALEIDDLADHLVTGMIKSREEDKRRRRQRQHRAS